MASYTIHILLAICWTGYPFGVCAEESLSDYLKLSIEELMNMEITSVSKKEERKSRAAAAISVITGDDIRRSGATSIPEVLRRIPGLHVARMDANKWAITSRGFNGRFANKLLVLIDGRSVYTPLFSGVYWEVQDTLLHDVERIEVIRGPGGTLWGANAVNGVINIITKKAHDTQGTLMSGLYGSEEYTIEGRHGGTFNDNAYYRFYLKGYEHDESAVNDRRAHDDWRTGRGGFRVDVDATRKDSITFQGDYYRGVAGQRISVPNLVPPVPPFSTPLDEDILFSGGNVLLRWNHHVSEDSKFTLQTYYDRTERDEFAFEENRDTFDIDLQHGFKLLRIHDVTWGLGYHFTADDFEGAKINVFDQQTFQIVRKDFVSLADTRRNDELFSAFAQDEISLIPDRLTLTLGSKLEHNDFTGFEVQPSARLTFAPSGKHTIWGSISRAVRTPSRADHDISIIAQSPPAAPLFRGLATGRFDSEELIAYEAGYRANLFDLMGADIAIFYNEYDNLQSLEFSGALDASNLPIITTDNKIEGESYGAEFDLYCDITEWCRLQFTYSFIKLQLHTQGSSTDRGQSEALFEGDSPEQQFGFRTQFNLPGNLELDTELKYVDQINTASGIPNYFDLDIRVGWKPSDHIELSLVVENILDSQRFEYISSTTLNTQISEVERSVYGKIVWTF